MKKIITILAFLFIIAFVSTTLYVFDVPPFEQEKIDQLLRGKEPEKTPNPKNTDTPKTPTPPKPTSDNRNFNELITKGDTLKENGFYDLAIKEYQTAQSMEPSNITPLIKISEIHLQSNNLEKAEEILKQALETDSTSLPAKLNLGRTLIAQRKIDEGRELFLNINAEDSQVKYYQGMIKILDGAHPEARQFFQDAINLNTDLKISEKAQKFLSAYQEFDSFQSGTDSHLNTLLGRAFTEVDEYQMAIPLLFEVIKIQNDYRDAWILLGYSYLKTQQYPEAVDALIEAEKIDPQKPETHFFLGLTYFNQDKLDLAANHLEKAKENGFQPEIQVEQKLAEIYTIQEKFDEAASNYENIISLNDKDINLFVQPIWIYLNKLNQPEKALSLAKKALNSHSQNAMSHNLMAWVQIESEDYIPAKAQLMIALELNPEFDAAHLNLGRIYEAQNNFSKAKQHYQKAYELGKGNSISELASEKYSIVAAKENETIQANIFQ